MIEIFKNENKDKSTADKLSEISAELILTKGYQGFSYQDLANELGIKKASIHYHFPNKEDLGKDFILKLRNSMENTFKSFDENKLNPKHKIYSYFKMFRYFVNSENMICPCGMLSSEINTLPEKMADELRLFFYEKNEWLEKTIKEGIELGYFRKELNAKDTSLLILSSIQGSIQLTRMAKDKKIFDSVIKSLKYLLGE